MTKSNHDRWRAAGSLMATFVVLMVGTLGILAVALLTAPENAGTFLLVCGGSFVVGSLLIFGVMPKVSLPTGALSWMNRRKAREEFLGYSPRIDKPRPVQMGTNQPPTADDVRELKDGVNNWVPSRSAAGRRRPSER